MVRTIPDFWTDPAADPRAGESSTRGEWDTLLDYLHHFRLTLAVKCAGLTPAQLATRAVPPSSVSLLGLVRHLARVEHYWFRIVMERAEIERLFIGEGEDAGFGGFEGTQAELDAAWALWQGEVAHAEAFLATQPALDTLGLHHGEELELRDLLVHLIEEYARHCGHADLVREVLDGRTGD